jgi:hypothetical protein
MQPTALPDQSPKDRDVGALDAGKRRELMILDPL